MIQTQTFEFQGSDEERQFLHDVLWLMAERRYTDAQAMLIARHDKLTANPKLKLYDQREERHA
jgi:hypothetical protein